MIRLVAVVMMAMAIVLPASAQDSTPAVSPETAGEGGLAAATSWLLDQQLENGAFAGYSGEEDAGTTVDAIIALVAANNAGIDTADAVDTAIAWLGTGDIALVYEQTGVGQAAKLVLALVAAGENPADISGSNPISIVEAGQDAESGFYGEGLYNHAYAILALAATGNDVPSNALDVMASSQAENGGWAFDGATDPAMADSNTTAMVVQALVASGNADHEMMALALDFLASTVTDTGAAYAPGAEVDANSTALVLQAMIATGGETSGLDSALASFQLESGAYFYQSADTSENLFSTVQAIPAMAGAVLPVAPSSDATPVALFPEFLAPAA